ncbi:glycosyltransferase [Methylomagnum sp.]
MKILWISPTPSHPQDAGNRAHIFAMAQKILAAGHQVTFLLYGQEWVTPEAKAEMQKFWPEFVFVPHRLGKERKKSKGEVWGIDDWFNSDLEISIKTVESMRQFDTVYCEYVFFSKALTLFPSYVYKVLSCHDRMSGRAELLKKQGIPPDFFYTTPDQEKIALNRADIVIAIQEDERRFFQSLTKRPVIEVGYPVKPDFLPERRLGHKLRVGYIGSNNSLNRKSLEVFMAALRELPAVASGVEVVAAGTICKSLENHPVTCLGIVPEEADLYKEVDLVINPMVDGTGLKIKTLSAIRHGMPFLSTETGSKGIPVVLAEHYSDSIRKLVSDLAEVVNNPWDNLPKLRRESLRLFDIYQERQNKQIQNLLFAMTTRNARHIREKKVLMVTDVPFWEPGLGNHARILAMCNELRRHASLTVFFYGSLWRQREELIAKVGLGGQVVSYKAFEEAGNKLESKSTCPRYAGLARWHHEVYFRSLKAYLDTTPHFDALIFQYIRLAYVRDALSYPALTVLDTHDLMSMREYRFLSQGLPHHISLTFSQERTLLERFNSVIAIQHEEAAVLESTLSKAIPVCCPHGCEVGEIVYEAKAVSKELRLGFVGGNSDANYLAIDWFLKQVWPVVGQLSIHLHIFGGVCQRFTSVPEKVHLHGMVEELAKVYAECDVMLNPMIHGGGIKIKSIEALAHGKPLIASPEGAVGIHSPEESGVIVAKDRAEFISGVLLLLENQREREAMAVAARSAAETQFSPEKCFAPLVELIESM